MATRAGRTTSATTLLDYLERIAPNDTWRGLAKLLSELAEANGRDLFHVADDTLMRYVNTWYASKPMPFGIGDTSRSGEWAQAVQALRRYLQQHPDLRVGQAVSNLSARFWMNARPDNRALVAVIRWELDGVNPHIGEPVVVHSRDGAWMLGVLVAQDRMGDEVYYRLEVGRVQYMFELQPDLQHLVGGGELRIIIGNGAEYYFRRVLMAALDDWFLNHEPSEYPWAPDPNDYVAWVKELGRQLNVPKVLVPLVQEAAAKAAQGDELLAAYLTHRLTDAWPKA